MELKGSRIHFMGIGGIGVSALAEMAKAAGALVSGCDRSENEITLALRRKGLNVALGHDPSHLDGVDYLVHTSAVSSQHPERLRAGEKQEKRGAFLARLMDNHQAIGVAGTHGKTTTSWLLSQLLIECGRDPTVFIGGLAASLPEGNYRLGSGPFVSELDESDESFLLPKLEVAVATNLESDHLSHYKTYPALYQAFQRYARGVEKEGLLVAGLDSPELAKIFAAHSGKKLSFGFNPACDIRATEVENQGFNSRFRLEYLHQDKGLFNLFLPGHHNVLNALAALGTCLALGLDPEELRSALPKAIGVGRRLEFLGEIAGARFYSDYAHHPTEIRACLAALKQAFSGPILAVFQPHLYSRTRDYAREFAQALAEGAEVVQLVDIYPAREEPIPGVDSALISSFARELNPRVEDPLPLAQAVETARDRAGDFQAVVMLGAGDIDNAARELFPG
ncbi:MAG: UDP-N-acetylmuramate--L-alanine ligase, partial [Planctomycetota bacterium]|nr:UDP-N-acetylmuramate--L-alanine ligase [Planctomycetota bacterium]